MLSKTPVIGSGLGGMRELLEDGRQIICTNFRGLKKEVQNLLEDSFLRKKIGEDGYNFAKNFTPEKFEQDWLNLIDNINS
jgi:glycosyltransferase involved in cell wall biosynthesis